jgi:hypothetical protein
MVDANRKELAKKLTFENKGLAKLPMVCVRAWTRGRVGPAGVDGLPGAFGSGDQVRRLRPAFLRQGLEQPV